MVGGTVAVARAVYTPATMTVGLYPTKRLNLHDVYQLTVNGVPLTGLTGASGLPLAGAGNLAGTNYVAPIRFTTLAGSSNDAFQPPFGLLSGGPTRVVSEAFDQLAVAGDLAARAPHVKHHHKAWARGVS